MITGYIPGYSRNGKTDRRCGDGLVLHSNKGKGYTLVVDGFDGDEPTTKLINYLREKKYTDLYLLLSHPHYDHYKGLQMIMRNKTFTVKKLYTYDPESYAFGIGSSANGRAVKEDYQNHQAIITEARKLGAEIGFLRTSKKTAIGDIRFKTWRKQPKKFTEYDDGNAYAFINDGSLCTYFWDLRTLLTGDGPTELKEALAYFDSDVYLCKVPHHGNSCSQSNAAALKSAGCKLAYQTNNEQNGPGTTSFTAYGSKRVKEQGIPVIQLDADITFTADKGVMTVKQGSKSWTFPVPYGIDDIKPKTVEKVESALQPAINPNRGFKGYNVSKRTAKIQYIVMHYTGAEGTAANNVAYFNGGNRNASADYFVGFQGEICQYNPDILNQYSWHCGGGKQSNKGGSYFGKCTNGNSIGIEMCTTKASGAWTFKEATLNAAAQLVKWLMYEYGIPVEHVIRHYDVTGKNCPGVSGWGYTGGEAKWLAWKKRLGETPKAAAAVQTDQEKFLAKIGPLAKADAAKSGILASITLAQAALESGWGKSELAVKAYNLFGMKCALSGNTWKGSTWDEKSAYNKSTGEYYSGSYTTIKADFRKYKSWAESVGDHSAYLAGAMNGSKKRYAGLVGCTDYKKAAQIIKNGGYATSPDYVSKLVNLIESYKLTQYDDKQAQQAQRDAAKNQQNQQAQKASLLPYLVKVTAKIPVLKAPAGAKVKDCPVGIYTIVEKKNGYGKLKSGAGWIQLSKVSKM